MTDLLMVRKGYTLRPFDDVAEEDMLKLGEGPFIVKVTKPRSLPHNRFYWSILRSIVNGGGLMNEDDLHNATKIKCGLVSMCQLPNGEFMAFPDSTAFSKLDQDGFNRFFERAVEFWKSSGLYSWIAPDLRSKIEDGERRAAA